MVANHTELSRYDGNEFKKYTHSTVDTNSISTNTIRRVTTDQEGFIWAYGIDKVCNKLDPSTGKSTKVRQFFKHDTLQTGSAPNLKHFGTLRNGDFILLSQDESSINQNEIYSLWKYNPGKNAWTHLVEVFTHDASIDYFTNNTFSPSLPERKAE